MGLAYSVYIGTILVLTPLLAYPAFLNRILDCNRERKILFVNKLFGFYLPIVFFSLIFGLRYNVGVDYLSYENIYNLQTDCFWDNIGHVEPLYALLSFILYKLNFPYYILTCIVCCVSITLLLKSVSDYNKLSPWAFYFCFVTGSFFVFFNLQRQSIAFFIFVYALKFVDKSFIKYLICIIIAFGFHYSSAILIFVYFFSKVKFYILDYLFVQLVVYFVVIFFRSEIEAALVFFSFLIAPEKYAGYGDRILNWRIDLGSGNGMIFLHIIDVLSIVIFSYFRRHLCVKYNSFDLIYRLWLMGIYFDLIFESNMLLVRIPLYLVSLKVILLAFLYSYICKYWRFQKGYVMLLSIILFVCYQIYFLCLIKNGSSLCSPYQFV